MVLIPFTVAELPATPWKNGGGSTREIACQPTGAGLHDFDWRVSIATIAQAGPFSAFPGVDRIITLLGGDGVRLRVAGGIDHRLDTPLAPFAFSGDAAVDCALLGGTSTDFNVMTRRNRCRADLHVWRVAGHTTPAGAGLLLAVSGDWQIGGEGAAHRCGAGSGLWWQGAPEAWRLTPVGDRPDAALIAVTIQPTQPIVAPSEPSSP